MLCDRDRWWLVRARTCDSLSIQKDVSPRTCNPSDALSCADCVCCISAKAKKAKMSAESNYLPPSPQSSALPFAPKTALTLVRPQSSWRTPSQRRRCALLPRSARASPSRATSATKWQGGRHALASLVSRALDALKVAVRASAGLQASCAQQRRCIVSASTRTRAS